MKPIKKDNTKGTNLTVSDTGQALFTTNKVVNIRVNGNKTK